MENVMTLLELYSKQRQLTHDFNNNINVIKDLATKGELEQIIYYIDTLKFKSENVVTVVKSDNVFVDAILNQKYIVCKNNKIAISFKIDNLSSIGIRQEDIVTILGNAIDNAIEACYKIENPRIKIKILSSEFETIISIHNTTKEDVVISQDNTIKTNKKNKLMHGFGLKNINSALEKYDFTLSLKSENRMFMFNLIIHK